MSHDDSTSWRPIRWLMLVLLAWGVCLAFGVARLGHDLPDRLWKAAIVSGCVLVFVGLWAAFLWTRRRGPEPIEPADEQAADRPTANWSMPCVASLVLTVLAAGCVLADRARRPATGATVTMVGTWMPALGVVAALVLAMVGLSDPRRRRGKWLAILALLAIVGLTATWLYLRPSVELG